MNPREQIESYVQPQFFEIDSADEGQDRTVLSQALQAVPAQVEFKYFYDHLGSTLFEAITHLQEYYPTRTEAGIIDRHLSDIASAVGPRSTLIDLGAGSCRKAARLLPVLEPAQYVAVDVSVSFLKASLQALQLQYVHCPMIGVGIDFAQRLQLPQAVNQQRRVFFYPGSSLGNFHPEDAVRFLQDVRAHCDEHGGLLLGLDLVKETSLLNAAYDDALGVTAAFNLNALNNINDALGSNFRVNDFTHVGFFNPQRSRIEMHLEAKSDVAVSWPDEHGKQVSRLFRQGERIHTESSYKYQLPQIAQLLDQAGFSLVEQWTDPLQHFAVVYAKPAK